MPTEPPVQRVAWFPPARVCQFGVFEVNLASRQIVKAGREVHLQEQPLRLLLLLLEQPGELRTREELQRRLWPNNTFVEFDDGLNTAIQKIRQVLGDEARNPRFVETVPRQGYRFIAPVRVLDTKLETKDEGAAPASVPSPPKALAAEPVIQSFEALTAPVVENHHPAPVIAGPRAGIDAKLAALVALGTGLAGLAIGWNLLRPPLQTLAPVIRVSITPPPGVQLRHGVRGGSAISPDGRAIVFAGSREGKTQLWLRRLDSAGATALPGTEDGALPFWSPDGRSIGFQAAGKIRRVDLAGGPPQDLAVATRPTRGTWTEQGEILFATGSGGPILSAPANGPGAPKPVVTGTGGASWPVAIPGTSNFLFYDNGARQISLGSLLGNAAPAVKLLPASTNAIYSPAVDGGPAHLLLQKGSTLVAQAFDAKSGKLMGDGVAIADSVGFTDRWWMMDATVSANGVLAYGSGNTVQSRLSWVDRDGRIMRYVDGQDWFRSIRLSADGRRALIERGIPRSLWMFDFARDVQSRISLDRQWSGWPVWSPDGSEIGFSAEIDGRVAMLLQSAKGGLAAVPIGVSKYDDFLYDWSRNGQYLIYTETNPQTKVDLWILPLKGDRQPRPFLRTPYNEDTPQFSPDGHWVAYVSDESGHNEVYVASFPGGEGKWQISTGGGSQPRWPANGELFYESSAGQIVAVQTKLGGAQFEWMTPKRLFAKPMPGRNYDVAPQGDRLLMMTPAEGSAHDELKIVINWPGALPR